MHIQSFMNVSFILFMLSHHPVFCDGRTDRRTDRQTDVLMRGYLCGFRLVRCSHAQAGCENVQTRLVGSMKARSCGHTTWLNVYGIGRIASVCHKGQFKSKCNSLGHLQREFLKLGHNLWGLLSVTPELSVHLSKSSG